MKTNTTKENINFTNHSRARCRQRGIPQQVVEFIVVNGDSFRTHADRKFYVNKKKLGKLSRKHKEFISKFDKQILSTAVVCNEGLDTIITAMKISGPLRWN
jgi:hypothetical protein